MKERERNKRLITLMNNLINNGDMDSVKLIETFIKNDTMAMQKTFDIMMKSFDYKTVDEFISKLDADMVSGDTDSTIIYIIEFFDTYLLANMKLVDKILETIDVDKYNEDILVALLCSTILAKKMLVNRLGLYERAKVKFEREIPNEVKGLLHGLK